jgi:hypothetical protein
LITCPPVYPGAVKRKKCARNTKRERRTNTANRSADQEVTGSKKNLLKLYRSKKDVKCWTGAPGDPAEKTGCFSGGHRDQLILTGPGKRRR